MGSMAIVKNIGTNWLYKKWVIGFSAKANYWISSLPYINENLQNSEINHLTVAVPEIWDILEMGKKSACTFLKF